VTLAAGDHLGAYEIVAPLGAGGMGEVYRARDHRLGRDVAIKVLPSSLTGDADRLRRFELEARAAAALNSPYLLAVYDIGSHQDSPYIVSELLEGETLASRLQHGALPPRKAIDVGVQIARGLAAAHDKGIVHRDLKPANIFVTTEGRAKILDFGLAKLVEQQPVASSTMLATTVPDTVPGTVLGTVGYMSPEQVRGQAADHRSDLFACGAVLYEMLSGRRAFEGATAADTMTAILKEDPADLPLAERHIPSTLARVVDRCLEKSPSSRFQSAGDLGFALDALSTPSSPSTQSDVMAGAPTPPATGGRSLPWVIAGLTSTALVAGLAFSFYSRAPGPEANDARTMRLSIELPGDWQLALANQQGVPTSLVVSPDGRLLAMVGRRSDGINTILLRPLDAVASQSLPGTEGVAQMFWSPDSRSLGFLADGKLKKVEVAGGVPTTLCDVPSTFGGGTWGTGGTIVFSSLSQQGSFTLKRMPSAGGEPAEVWSGLDVGESRIRPSFLPDGRHLLYASVAIGQVASQSVPIYLGALDSAERVQAVVSGSTNVQYAQGHLLFLREAALMAQPFDLDRLTTTGSAIVVADKIQRQGVQPPYGLFSASANGVLVYQTGTNAGAGGMQLAWVDRKGVLLERVGELANYSSVALSPNGTQAVVGETVPLPDLWTFDLRRSVKTRLTFGSATVLFPTWSPDGSRIAFGRSSAGVNILLKAANGSGGEDPALPPGREAQTPNDWSPDGRYLLYEKGVGSRADIWILPMAGDRTPVPFVVTSFRDGRARFSPDGRWVAYGSDESGRTEVYVTPFTAPESASAPGGAEGAVRRARQQVSPGGGDFIRWSRDGREIFYVSSPPNPSLMVVEVSAGEGGLMIGAVTKMFSLSYPSSNQGWFYDVAPDGQRFLMVVPQQLKLEGPPAMPTVVLNWAPSRAQ